MLNANMKIFSSISYYLQHKLKQTRAPKRKLFKVKYHKKKNIYIFYLNFNSNHFNFNFFKL